MIKFMQICKNTPQLNTFGRMISEKLIEKLKPRN
jgi:hypothetical protein